MMSPSFNVEARTHASIHFVVELNGGVAEYMRSYMRFDAGPGTHSRVHNLSGNWTDTNLETDMEPKRWNSGMPIVCDTMGDIGLTTSS